MNQTTTELPSAEGTVFAHGDELSFNTSQLTPYHKQKGLDGIREAVTLSYEVAGGEKARNFGGDVVSATINSPGSEETVAYTLGIEKKRPTTIENVKVIGNNIMRMRQHTQEDFTLAA